MGIAVTRYSGDPQRPEISQVLTEIPKTPPSMLKNNFTFIRYYETYRLQKEVNRKVPVTSKSCILAEFLSLRCRNTRIWYTKSITSIYSHQASWVLRLANVRL
jgi:hypothetical protein